jgi:hypothetical protein
LGKRRRNVDNESEEEKLDTPDKLDKSGAHEDSHMREESSSGDEEELKQEKKASKKGGFGVFDKEMKEEEEDKKIEDDTHDVESKGDAKEVKYAAEKGECLERGQRAARKNANKFIKGYANNSKNGFNPYYSEEVIQPKHRPSTN